MNDIIKILEQTIDDELKLKRDNRDWLISDTNVQMRSPHRHSMGFSLDIPAPNQKPLAFFSGHPPRYLAKMCDALIAVVDQHKLYLFAIEIKSSNKDGYCKQLANGRHFWRWLIALCKEHGYLPLQSEPLYIAVLIWKPREKQVRKGATAHCGNSGIKVTTQKNFTIRFEIKNLNLIILHELIQRTSKNTLSNSPWPKRKSTPEKSKR